MSERSAETLNRPGQAALSYRATTQAASLGRMLERLHTYKLLSGPLQGAQPLAALTTHAETDPTVALLDAWAAVLDVLGFYQERIIQENYLRTATELRSLRELAQAVGYQPAPAVSASTYLAFTADGSPGMPERVPIAAGAQVMSVPRSGELPQTFETSAPLTARAAWNELRLRTTQQQSLAPIAPGSAATPVTTLRLDGFQGGILVGDLLRIAEQSVVQVTGVTLNETESVTEVAFKVVSGPPVGIPAAAVLPSGDIRQVPPVLSTGTVVLHILARSWTEEALTDLLRARGWSESSFLSYVAAAQAAVTASQNVVAFRQRVSCFGMDALPYASLPVLDSNYYHGTDPYAAESSNWDATSLASTPSSSIAGNQRTVWLDSWKTRYAAGTAGCDLFLDRVVTGVVAGSSVLLACPPSYASYTVSGTVDTVVRGYGTYARSTGLRLSGAPATQALAEASPFLTRSTWVYLQSEKLGLSDTVPLAGQLAPRDLLLLDRMVLGLLPGQLLLVSGEAADTAGVPSSEIVVLAQATHRGGYTELQLRTPLSRDYLRRTLTVSANVCAATHGQTVRDEILGSGDAGTERQRFTLRQAPLTYVPSGAVPTPGSDVLGAVSTLEVRVNGVLWQQVRSLLDQDGKSPCYVVERDESGTATVLFGDGVHGARLPSGQDNVVARYRVGGGPAGEVAADSLKILLTRPLGLRSVTNPLASSGGSAAATEADIRAEVPVSLQTLDRAVSLLDYETLARSYPGISKAAATAVSLGGAGAVHLTVATDDGQPLSSTSALYVGLLQTLLRLGNPLQTLLVSDYRPVKFRVSAKLVIDPRHEPSVVCAQAEDALGAAFSFAAGGFAQPVYASDVIAVLQQTAGVVGVTLQKLYVAGAGMSLAPVLKAARARVDRNGVAVGAELLLIEQITLEAAP